MLYRFMVYAEHVLVNVVEREIPSDIPKRPWRIIARYSRHELAAAISLYQGPIRVEVLTQSVSPDGSLRWKPLLYGRRRVPYVLRE